MLVSGGADGTVRGSGPNPQKGVAVQSVALSRDGSTVAAGPKDRTVRWWRPVRG
jgi:hypothetical protein